MPTLERLVTAQRLDPCPIPADHPDRESWDACADNPLHFLRTCCSIFHKDKNRWLPFHPWACQEVTIAIVLDKKVVVILKARQQGFTWLILCLFLWLCFFRPVQQIYLFSIGQREAKDLTKFRLAGVIHRLPNWLRQAIGPVQLGAEEITFPNGSRIVSLPSTGGRSFAATAVLVDEADFNPDLDALLAAAEPTVDGGGFLVLLSTADKTKPLSRFKGIYRAALEGVNNYTPLFFGWDAHPGRSPDWHAAQKRKIEAETGSLDLLWQEYPATVEEAFAANTLDKRLPPQWLAQCFEPLAPIELSELQHLEMGTPALPQLSVYKLPVRGRKYVIGVDLGEGLPQSNDSAFDVFDRDSFEQVASFAAKTTPQVTAGLAATVARWYNGAGVLPERNNHGHLFIGWMLDHAADVFLLPGHDGNRGWVTNSGTKPILYDRAAELLRDQCVKLHDRAVYHQLGSIELSTLSAPEGLPDDRAMSAVLGLTACATAPRGVLAVY